MKTNLNRLTKALYVLAIIFAGCKDKDVAALQEEKKPNIVFILADDLGIHDLSVTGSTFYETPNIDRIAHEGIVFSQGYAASSVCSPSRASIMTGKFTARHGVTDWIGAKSGEEWRSLNRNNKILPAAYNHGLPKEDITLAEALKENGYATFFAGKWHLGDKSSYPEHHGFDTNIGGWHVGSPKGGYFSPWENPNLENKEKGENLSMRLAQETVDFIKKHKDTSFFAMLSFYAVHGPIQTTKEKWRKYRNKAEKTGITDHGFEMERILPIRTVQDNPIYAGLLEHMDDAVGLVLHALEELGLEENTVVVFTSDNGGVASGDAFSTTNLPLRGGKGYQWEGGIREPYFIKVPWIDRSVTEIDYPVTGADLYPTILDLTNSDLRPKQHIDGMSLKPLMEGSVVEKRPLYWHYPHYGNQGGEPSSILRNQQWKLIYYWEDERSELYNLHDDPGEQKDVSAEFNEITQQMTNQLQNFLISVEAKIPVMDTLFDIKIAQERYQNRKTQLMPQLEKERKEMLQKDFEPNKDWWGSIPMD